METQPNDHDLLVRLDAKLDYLTQEVKGTAVSIGDIYGRVATLENKDSRDSERIKAIDVGMKQLIENNNRLSDIASNGDVLNEKISTLESQVKDLQARSNAWNIINSVGIAILTALGVIFR